MRRVPVLALILAAFLVFVYFPACQSPKGPTQTDNDLYMRDQIPNPDDPYGGFNLADEEPAFSDPKIMGEFSDIDEAEYDDPISNLSSVMDLERRLLARLFLRITWGNLGRDSTLNFVTDWSGSLTVDEGAILLKRVIRFEFNDRIILRTNPGLLEWISHTQLGFDGILVRVIPLALASSIDTPIDTNAVVTFSTGPLSVSFTVAELRDIHEVIPVDDAGNAVSFDAIYVPPFPCPHGFLAGIWKNHPDTTGGIFFGKWVSESGFLMGHLRGFYGVNSSGEHVFFGKYIDRTGRFRGILRGRYGFFEGEDHAGFFEGVWIDRGLSIRGCLKGVWKTSDEINGGGFFRGGWRMWCRR